MGPADRGAGRGPKAVAGSVPKMVLAALRLRRAVAVAVRTSGNHLKFATIRATRRPRTSEPRSSNPKAQGLKTGAASSCGCRFVFSFIEAFRFSSSTCFHNHFRLYIALSAASSEKAPPLLLHPPTFFLRSFFAYRCDTLRRGEALRFRARPVAATLSRCQKSPVCG
jgi:hypothetical protein